ncbi:MAG: DUF2851 family protein [Verrucomicrobiales bacterium]
MITSAAMSYRDLLVRVFGESRIAEDEQFEGFSTRPPEIELQSRWFAGDFGRRFTALSGQEVEIVQFGVWNHAAGPDFCEVVIDVAGRQLRGALEIDMDARDWERHGHALNPAYDNVVLHMFFDAPQGQRFFTRTSQHAEVTQVRLDLAALGAEPLRKEQAEARWGRCSFPLRELSADRLHSLLEAAARHRIGQKAKRLARVAGIHGWDQAIYQELAGALGYRRNQLPMTVMAQRLPLKFLTSHKAGAEALLFGVAGFLEARVYEGAAADTRDYLRRLWEMWWKHRDEFAGASPPQLIAGGSRPLNHPQRRIGALAVIVTQWRRIRQALEGGERALMDALRNVRHPYWEHHYTLTSQPNPRPMALIGESRILDILANIGFPIWSRTTDDWWAAYARLPASLDNEKSRRGGIRLLGQRADAGLFTRKLFQHQALIQIYQDFCLQDNSDCAKCLFPEQLVQWT